jgi:REP element-mobilizing transposase RayT
MHPVRKPTRIPGFDYAKEYYYFVTVCTDEKKCIFGSIDSYSLFGSIAYEVILDIPNHHPGVRVDKFVVMPNHIHMIIVMGCGQNLNTVVGSYKSSVSRKIHQISEIKVWQRSYHDHSIRNDRDYQRIWSYIDTNPMRWEKDCFYTE